MVLFLLAVLFFPLVAVNAQISGTVCIGSGCSVGSGGGLMMDSHGLPAGSIFGILQNLLNWLLALFGIFGIIGFVLSGIFYLVSAGDEGMAEKGKEGMKWSIIGIIVICFLIYGILKS